MELRRLRLLHELSRLGTVAAVAEALSYSPSSVSVQLAQLEREAGAKLLRRAGRNVELTPAGRRLAAYAALGARRGRGGARGARGARATRRAGGCGWRSCRPRRSRCSPASSSLLAEARPTSRSRSSSARRRRRSRTCARAPSISSSASSTSRCRFHASRDVDRRDLIREDVLLALAPGASGGAEARSRPPRRLRGRRVGHRPPSGPASTRSSATSATASAASSPTSAIAATTGSCSARWSPPAGPSRCYPRCSPRRCRSSPPAACARSGSSGRSSPRRARPRSEAPAVLAVREALRETARRVAAGRRELEASRRQSLKSLRTHV